jgi:hypothetical protein
MNLTLREKIFIALMAARQAGMLHYPVTKDAIKSSLRSIGLGDHNTIPLRLNRIISDEVVRAKYSGVLFDMNRAIYLISVALEGEITDQLLDNMER